MSKLKVRRSKGRTRYYGTVKLKAGSKYAWLSQQNKNGWSLGLALNNRTVWLRNIRFATRKEVEKAMERSKLVFIQLKNNPKE